MNSFLNNETIKKIPAYVSFLQVKANFQLGKAGSLADVASLISEVERRRI
jgi:hypothetical protein